MPLYSKIRCPTPWRYLFVLNRVRRSGNVTEIYFYPLHLTPIVPIPLRSTWLVRWTPLPDVVTKLNFDGTLSQDGAVAGYLLRDTQGRFLRAGTRFMFQTPILVAEAMALRDGLKTAKDARFKWRAIIGLSSRQSRVISVSHDGYKNWFLYSWHVNLLLICHYVSYFSGMQYGRILDS